MKKFIQKLQNSDEATKKRWLFGATSVTMIFVIALWSVYISYSVENLNTAAETKENGLSFSTVFSTGFKILSEETITKLKTLIAGAEPLTILKKDFDFTLDTLEEIPPTPLP